MSSLVFESLPFLKLNRKYWDQVDVAKAASGPRGERVRKAMKENDLLEKLVALS